MRQYFLLAMAVLVVFFVTPVNATLTLTNNANDYTIENSGYYRAVIPKTGQDASGTVKQLYIWDGSTWSANVVYGSTAADYGFGYLEGGVVAATGNASYGLSGNATVTLITNNSKEIAITAVYDQNSVLFTQTWSFWDGRPYFQSESSAVQKVATLSNQYQFAWMIDSESLTVEWWANDKSGAAEQHIKHSQHPLTADTLNSFPWVNCQFVGEGVSVGLVFVEASDWSVCQGELGDWDFEYQFNFSLGTGALGTPITVGQERSLTTVYVVASSATNTDILAFASNRYQNTVTGQTNVPHYQASGTVLNPYAQNTGIGSALINSPYFILRQNTQNDHNTNSWSQFDTSFFGPLWKKFPTVYRYDAYETFRITSYYDTDSTTYEYEEIASATATGDTKVTHAASSSDGEVDYSLSYETWADSDKLQVTGVASNGDESSTIRDIWVEIDASHAYKIQTEAGSVRPNASVIDDLVIDDNLWTSYNYSWNIGTSLIYRDNAETVPALEVNLGVPTGVYAVYARVGARIEGPVTYSYSVNGVDFTTFQVDGAAENSLSVVFLGSLTIVNGGFWIDDDDTTSGLAGYGCWDGVTLLPTFSSLGSGVYDLQCYDDWVGKTGVAVKVNSPSNHSVDSDKPALRVSLLDRTSEAASSDFSYSFDIEIFPHDGWLLSPSEFTALRSAAGHTYTKHNFYGGNATYYAAETGGSGLGYVPSDLKSLAGTMGDLLEGDVVVVCPSGYSGSAEIISPPGDGIRLEKRGALSGQVDFSAYDGTSAVPYWLSDSWLYALPIPGDYYFSRFGDGVSN